MKIKNFTPHTINVVDNNGKEITSYLPQWEIEAKKQGVKNPNDEFKAKYIARLEFVEKPCDSIDDIEVVQISSKKEIVNLPLYASHTRIIVSRLVLMSSDRCDLLCPAGFIRDGAGRVVAATKFSRRHIYL